jgi:WD40 repeat protein
MSWKKPMPEYLVGSLTSDPLIEGHSMCIWNIAWLGASSDIMNTSEDGSIRQWTKDGKQVGEPWGSDGVGIQSIAFRLDQTSARGEAQTADYGYGI